MNTPSNIPPKRSHSTPNPNIPPLPRKPLNQRSYSADDANPRILNAKEYNQSIEDQIKEKRGNSPVLTMRLALMKNIGLGSGLTKQEELAKKKMKRWEEMKSPISPERALEASAKDLKEKSILTKISKLHNTLKTHLSKVFGNSPNNKKSNQRSL